MIQLHSDIVAAIASRPVEYFHLLKISDNTGSVVKAVTTHWSNLTVDSVEYIGNSAITGLDAPLINTTVDREQYRIALADPDFTDSSLIEEGIVNYSVEVRIGFCNVSTRLPMLTTDKMFLVYAGKVDEVNYNIDTKENGEATLILKCSSPLADLDLKRAMYCSRDYMRGRYADDCSCDQVYGGSGVLQLKWGKS